VKYAEGPTAEAAVHVAAPPERVWELVSDIHLIASISTELQEVEWVDGPARLGAVFRGRNRHPMAGEWTTTSHVVEFDPPRAFAWAVEDPANPTALWRFELAPREGGTDLRQWARMGPGPSHLNRLIAATPDREEWIVERRLARWRAGMDANLAAITKLAQA
jgi:uncharacterized protein YndB with AHSA1/START domain